VNCANTAGDGTRDAAGDDDDVRKGCPSAPLTAIQAKRKAGCLPKQPAPFFVCLISLYYPISLAGDVFALPNEHDGKNATRNALRKSFLCKTFVTNFDDF